MSNCYPNGAPLPADTPPWGIHAIDPKEAHHGGALADEPMRYRLGPGARGLIQKHLDRIRTYLAFIDNILENSCDHNSKS